MPPVPELSSDAPMPPVPELSLDAVHVEGDPVKVQALVQPGSDQADVAQGQGQLKVEKVYELVPMTDARICYVCLLCLVREKSMEGTLVRRGVFKGVPEGLGALVCTLCNK